MLTRNIEACDPERHPELRKQAIERMIEFDVSIRSGMRRSEQYNLRWPDVEFDRKIMRLRMTKNGKPRNAFIIEDVKKSLLRLKDLDVRQRAGRDSLLACADDTRPDKSKKSRDATERGLDEW